MMAVTNLTNTCWRFDKPIGRFNENTLSFDIRGTVTSSNNPSVSSTSSNHTLYYSYSTQFSDGTMYFPYNTAPRYNWKVPSQDPDILYVDSDSVGHVAKNVVFYITGGSSVTNTTLINWLDTYTTQVFYYTVYFNTNGGTPVASQVVEGNLPNPIPTTTKTGYYFEGWYYDNTFKTRAFDGEAITSDVTLYAHWISAPGSSVSVTYDGDEIVEFSSGTKTLKCAGKVMNTDVEITVT